MAFNAGGANVAGVQAIEQGSLVGDSDSSAFSQAGGETKSHYFTVPAGKKWILKNTSFTVGTFVGTISNVKTQVVIDGTAVVLDLTSSSSTTYSYNQNQQLTLKAGDRIDLRITTTAWTSGQLLLIALYQEIDA